ncbi:MAG: penicillin-binding transpeptidase domain-containing protein, partial [Planctomycetota bacterium]|nr:penicillin-binding transpeptidase domain-containing protein [Planctomycetota bacterium]
MLNRPTTDYRSPNDESRWHIDRRPTLRLCLMFVAFLLPMTAIVWRLVSLQSRAAESFIAEFEQTFESYEPIPCRDGRILAADGRILAEDVLRFDVHVHFRWLQDPVDQRWLIQQTNHRLTRAERRVSSRVEETRSAIVAERQDAWTRLADLTQTPPAELVRRRKAVQQRVEKMIRRVEEVRRDRERTAGSDEETSATRRAWNRFRQEMTTPPKRSSSEPIELKEEQDYHPLLSNVPFEVAVEIEAHPELYPGVRITTSSERVYPQGRLAAHVIGLRGAVTGDEVRARQIQFPDGDPLDYQTGDQIGRSGVERSYDLALRGLRGRRLLVKNRRGEVLRTELLREPRDGRDVQLTFNLDLQERAEGILAVALGDATSAEPNSIQLASHSTTNDDRPVGGCIIVMDVWTGSLVAMASAPTFDLEAYRRGDAEAIPRWESDRRHPFVHRAAQMALPPGSVFKTLSSVAILESGIIDPDAALECRGYLDNPSSHRCYRGIGHGDTTLAYAICRSCNVYFFDRARRIGARRLHDCAQRFGFGQPTGIDIPGERPGHLPSPAQRPWYEGDTMGLAIGQSRLTTTPLQVVRMMAAVANDGLLVTPHVADPTTTLISGAQATPGEVLPTDARNRRWKIPQIEPHILERVREGLDMVVQNPRGTGYGRVRLDEIAIAGKTGTAEAGGGRPDHAWFAGYVPAQQPRYSFVVVLEHGGS